MTIETPNQRRFVKIISDSVKPELVKFINEHLIDGRWSLLSIDKDHGFYNATLVWDDSI